MLRHYGLGMTVFLCAACGGITENVDEDLGVAEEHIWNGTATSQPNIPQFVAVDGERCSSVLLTPNLALTANHCSNVLPITANGVTTYAYLRHQESALWEGAQQPRVSSTWAPPDAGAAEERKLDVRVLAFANSAAPLTVFPQRIRYFDSPGVEGPAYLASLIHRLPVVMMGWGITKAGTFDHLFEQRAYTAGNELGMTLGTFGDYRDWRANLGNVGSYMGPDTGDSGGPLFRQLMPYSDPREYELLGLSAGVDKDENGNDPRLDDSQQVDLSAAEKAVVNARTVNYHWVDVTHPTFLRVLYSQFGDPKRPGRLLGERDYYGPSRLELDPDGDRYYGTAGKSCPMHLYDRRGATGELSQAGGVAYYPDLGSSPPALHAYRSLYLNDRTRVFSQSGGWGTVVLGSREARIRDNASIVGRLGTDTDVGTLIAEGGGILSVSDRTKIRSAWWWANMTMDFASGTAVSNTSQGPAMRVPESRLAGTFPIRQLGVHPPVTKISAASYWKGDCISTAYCHVYQGIEPNTNVTLAKGYFGDLSVKSNSTLTLSGGDYYFDGLAMESDSSLVVVAGKSARVWVRDNLSLRNYGNIVRTTNAVTGLAQVTDTSAAANLFIGYYGLSAVSVWELSATLVAPYAKVTLETNRSWATAHSGMVIANHIEMHQGNSFYHVPYICK